MKKISRNLTTTLLVAAVVMSAAIGIAAAVTTTNQIEFNLNQGAYYTNDPVTGTYTYVPASAVINGIIKNKDGTLYISPQTGTITIDGVDHNIQVKNAKQPEPILYYKYEYGTPGQYYYKYEYWYDMVEVNIEGNKYIGWLYWSKYHQEYYSTVYDYASSQLGFQGIVDGKMVSASVWAPNLPVIS